ncbi:MAG: DUF5916 domain-containing protein [Gemmatimonadota bacterium]
MVPTLRAGRAVGIHLDGRLDEPAWREADSLSPLRQVVPVAGAMPTGATVVRVLASSSEIVIGVMAYDPSPERIVSFSKAVDSDLEDEDNIRLVFDTFRDGRTGYVFAVNPNGARFDGLVSNRGEGTNSAWDGLWEARTERRPDGWSVEIRIPLKSLIYASGLTTWGFNIERRIQRLQETNRWASPTPDIELGQTSRAGELTNLPVFSLGVGLAVRPSLTVGGGNSASTDIEGTFHPSLDLTQRIAGGTLASLTINTDFAETEVDTRRTNLTRFPVLFPEKRSFFLEGADVFEFGLGLQNSFGGNQVLPFFSRRIGLVSGEQVPLQVGGKLNGQVGNTSIGALAVRTGTVESVAEGATMGVLRLKQNVLGESSVGVIATAGDPRGRADSWTGGVDFTFQTSRLGGDKNFLLGVYGVMTGREGLDGDRLATGFKIDYPNDLWDLALTYNHIGDGFDPSMGFVPRRGINSVNGGFSFQPRIGNHGLRQCFLEVRPSWTGDLSWDWESYRFFTAPVNCQLESGDRFEFNWVPQGERLDQPFEVTDLVTIVPGAYHYTRWRLELETASKRPVSGQLTWWFGGFYNGTLHTIEAEATLRLSGSFVVELNAERNVGSLSGGDFTEDLVGGRFNVNVSPDLVFSSFLQYDTESRSLGSNSRLRWTFDPLGALFVVYNHNMAREFDDRWLFDSNQLLIKVQYTLRY